MPILELQLRDRELGRIRMGVKVPNAGGKDGTHPEKLSTWRVTSRDRKLVEAVAAKYGGTVQEWTEGGRKEWQVITASAEMRVVITGDPISQWMERWNGGTCERRCDGVNEALSGQPCICKALELERKKACVPKTRFLVRLPDIPDMGVWRLETSGWNAAKELAAAYEFIQTMYARSVVIPCLLALEERSGKDENKKTTRFMVPVIRIPTTMLSLMQRVGTDDQTGIQELGAPSVPMLPTSANPELSYSSIPSAFGHVPANTPKPESHNERPTTVQKDKWIGLILDKDLPVDISRPLLAAIINEHRMNPWDHSKAAYMIGIDFLSRAPQGAIDQAVVASRQMIQPDSFQE